MAWPTYSERFLENDGQAGIVVRTVPPGRRWVVKTITGTSVSSPGGGAGVYCAEHAVWYRLFPVTNETAWVSGHIVLYSGEKLRINTGVLGIYVTVSGYELADPAGASSAAAAPAERWAGGVDVDGLELADGR